MDGLEYYMDEFKYHMCIVGQLSPRQKIMTTKFIRESEKPVISMDETNAKKKELVNKAKYLVVFSVGKSENHLEGLPIEWPIGRILVEEDDFPYGTFPEKD